MLKNKKQKNTQTIIVSDISDKSYIALLFLVNFF